VRLRRHHDAMDLGTLATLGNTESLDCEHLVKSR
jgi:hypothetical protein